MVRPHGGTKYCKGRHDDKQLEASRRGPRPFPVADSSYPEFDVRVGLPRASPHFSRFGVLGDDFAQPLRIDVGAAQYNRHASRSTLPRPDCASRRQPDVPAPLEVSRGEGDTVCAFTATSMPPANSARLMQRCRTGRRVPSAHHRAWPVAVDPLWRPDPMTLVSASPPPRFPPHGSPPETVPPGPTRIRHSPPRRRDSKGLQLDFDVARVTGNFNRHRALSGMMSGWSKVAATLHAAVAGPRQCAPVLRVRSYKRLGRRSAPCPDA